MKSPFSGLALMMVSTFHSFNPYLNKQTITTPKSPVRSTYKLPLWAVGKYPIYAKNEHDALKYAKKRGLWDGISIPKRIK